MSDYYGPADHERKLIDTIKELREQLAACRALLRELADMCCESITTEDLQRVAAKARAAAGEGE